MTDPAVRRLVDRALLPLRAVDESLHVRAVDYALARFCEESDMVTDPEEFSESSASHLVSEEVLLHREPDGGIEAAQSNMSHG